MEHYCLIWRQAVQDISEADWHVDVANMLLWLWMLTQDSLDARWILTSTGNHFVFISSEASGNFKDIPIPADTSETVSCPGYIEVVRFQR